jgi:hypothetical protein
VVKKRIRMGFLPSFYLSILGRRIRRARQTNAKAPRFVTV